MSTMFETLKLPEPAMVNEPPLIDIAPASVGVVVTITLPLLMTMTSPPAGATPPGFQLVEVQSRSTLSFQVNIGVKDFRTYPTANAYVSS